jgi:beta-1,4-mannosyl-glycoprotein beta-1,4-N-acetylglucosaminyltransferase
MLLNKFKKYIKFFLNDFRNIKDSIISPFLYIQEKNTRKKWLLKEEIFEYRKKIKIYDIVTFFNEIELLEIRLNILDKYVDYFIIIEATETFTGIPKKLYFEENKNLFKKWEHKIIHYITNDTPKDREDLKNKLTHEKNNDLSKQIINDTLTSDNVPLGQNQWLKEFYQKESIKKALIGIKDDDFCYISDVDEIWNPEIIIDYSKDYIFKYRQDPYVYYLNNRSNENWVGWTGPIATKYKNIKNNCLNHLRTHKKTKGFIIKNSGWHFTFQGEADRIIKKLESYGHQEINTNKIKSKLKETLLLNKDIRGRHIKFWKDESNLPKYLLENKQKYIKLFK